MYWTRAAFCESLQAEEWRTMCGRNSRGGARVFVDGNGVAISGLKVKYSYPLALRPDLERSQRVTPLTRAAAAAGGQHVLRVGRWAARSLRASDAVRSRARADRRVGRRRVY